MSDATGSREAKQVGVSPDYLRLLRGEISAQEYIRRLSVEVAADRGDDDD